MLDPLISALRATERPAGEETERGSSSRAGRCWSRRVRCGLAGCSSARSRRKRAARGGDPPARARRRARSEARRERGCDRLRRSFVSLPQLEAYQLGPSRPTPSRRAAAAARTLTRRPSPTASASTRNKAAPGIDRPGPSNYPRRARLNFSAARTYTASGRVTALAIGRLQQGQLPPVARCGRRRRVGCRQGAHENANVNWSSSPARSAPTRSARSSTYDATRRNTLYAGTGEPNASGDTEAGLGSTSRPTEATRGRTAGDHDTTSRRTPAMRSGSLDEQRRRRPAQHCSTSASPSGLRGISSCLSAGSIGAPTPACRPRCLPEHRRRPDVHLLLLQIGERPTFPLRGSRTSPRPDNPNVVYQAAFAEGVWRSLDNGATWTQILSALNPARRDRPHRVRGQQAAERQDADVRRHRRNAAFRRRASSAPTTQRGAAVFTDMTTPQNINYCSASAGTTTSSTPPAGNPDAVYLGGSFYDNAGVPVLGGDAQRPNGPAFSTRPTAGANFSDLTLRSSRGNQDGMHPDQHALVIVPDEPGLHVLRLRRRHHAVERQLRRHLGPVRLPRAESVNLADCK